MIDRDCFELGNAKDCRKNNLTFTAHPNVNPSEE